MVKRKIEPLLRGDSIGIVAPAGVVHKPSIEAGIKFLKEQGFRIKLGDHVYSREGYLAGSDEQRADDLNKMLADNEIKAVFCARGGYGSVRILPYMDLKSFSGNPKIIMGFSDITVLLLHVLNKTQTVTFHGPVVSKLNADSPPETVECMLEVLRGDIDVDLARFLPEDQPVRVLRHGNATGCLMGGCLSMLQTVVGTDLQINLKNKILFWEEVGEQVYRIDRMIDHLSRAGFFDNLKGMIIGKLTGCFKNQKTDEERFLGIISKYFGSYDYPIIYNLPIGHSKLQLTLPEGGTCYLNTRKSEVIINSGLKKP